jgi:DNA-binding CsgD family transcriptional regulator
VLIALGEGKTTVEIRSDLKIAAKTVNTYVLRLKRKLAVANMNQLIRAAALLGEGIIPSEPSRLEKGLRLCAHCRNLFSVELVRQNIAVLAGYRVLADILRRHPRRLKGEGVTLG